MKVLALLTALSVAGCIATDLATGSLDGLSPTFHADLNAPECVWVSSESDGCSRLNLAVRASVRIRHRLSSVEAPAAEDNWRCEDNGPVVVRYRLDTDDEALAIESIEPWDGTRPAVASARVRVVESRVWDHSTPFHSDPIGMALHSRDLPRGGPTLLVWKDGMWTWPRDHGPEDECRSIVPIFIGADGRPRRLEGVFDDVSIVARTAEIVMLPFTWAIDIALTPLYVLAIWIWFVVNPPFI